MKSIHNHFKHAIQNGQKQIGLWSHLCSPISIEILAHCGYDWLLLDMEHSPNDISEILAQLQAMKGGTATPIVRPPWNDMVTFKRLLDIGVQNLLVPYIQTAEEARNALFAVQSAVEQIKSQNGNIASAAEQQSNVAENINQKTQQISKLARDSAQQSEVTRSTSSVLMQQCEKLVTILSDYKVH